MKNKRTIIVAALLVAAAAGATAQGVAEPVQSPLVSEKDFVWYVGQTAAWRSAVQEHPDDEHAWLNYYKAAHYSAWYNEGDTTEQQVLREMATAIPDSYTYYHCAYRAHGDDAMAEAALTRLPQDMSFYDYDIWTCYLAKRGDEERLGQMARRYFDSGIYSASVLQYSYNELQGMDEGGIYIGNGDAVLVPKWLLQQGMGVHQDKVIVCTAYLAVSDYREWLFRKLGLGDVPTLKEPTCSEDYDDNQRTLIQAIIDRSGRPVYFSPTNGESVNAPWRDHLYNEGLVLKYSPRKYDNMAVKRRNVEQRYLMEYLLVSFRPDWTSGERLSANYAVMLADLLPYYKQRDKQRYEWLMRLLVSGVTNTSFSEERKQGILKLLMR